MFTHHYRLFWQRWTTSAYYAYVNWQTNVWWSRLDSNYDVYNGQAQNCWSFPAAWNCSDGQESHQICSQVPFSPNWPGATGDSTTYVYNGPMNTWPAMYRTQANWPFNWSFSMSTQVAKAGAFYYTINDSYSPPVYHP